MCGIFGAVGVPVSDEAARNVLLMLRHRGPEAQGVERIGQAVLAHTRLRILDLSPSGAQPMANEDGSVWVTFNGEIYNFLLAAAGTGRLWTRVSIALRHRGDRPRVRAVGRRRGDPPGRHVRLRSVGSAGDACSWREIAPARSHCSSPSTAAACCSRPRSRPCSPPAFRPRSISTGWPGFLAYGYAPPPGTMYRGVRQLPPAHRLVYTEASSTLRIDRYWSLDFTPRCDDPEPQATERVRSLVTEAVRKRMVADVPVGAFLSGGVDSTIIVGIMARLGHKVRTFSIGFSGDPRYDETRFARIAANAFGTEHTEFTVNPSDFEILDDLVWHHDGPFGDSSAIPTYVVSRLDASAGDGGVDRRRRRRVVRRLSAFLGGGDCRADSGRRSSTGKSLAALIPEGLPSRSLAARVRRFLNAADLPLSDRLTQWNSYFAFNLDEILRPDVRAAVNTDSVLDFHRRLFASPAAESNHAVPGPEPQFPHVPAPRSAGEDGPDQHGPRA